MNRRDFVTALAAQALPPARRTNLLYILVDQLSGLALPSEDKYAQMPNCQRLARSGVRFSHAYTAGMTCGPSRASLDTGLHTRTHGVGGGKPLEQFASLPRALAGAGYVSSHPNGYSLEDERAGHEKWLADLGYSQPLSSLNGVDAMARYLDLPLKWKCGRAGLAPEHGFDAYCAQRAIRFLETNRDRPFACFLQLRGPHDPYMTPRPFDTLVNPNALALPPYLAGEFANKPKRQREAFESQGASRMTDAQVRQILAVYYGMAAYADRCVGDVLGRLTELGLDDNTVVILVADHGDTMGRHRMMSKDFAFYEPAVRIPLIIRAPGARPAGVVRNDPVSGVDVFPTLCQLLSLPTPDGVQGESLVARWEDRERKPSRPIYAGQGIAGKTRAVMLRTPRYKLTRYDDGGGELYDLEKDPDELENRLGRADYARVASDLTGQLEAWERS